MAPASRWAGGPDRRAASCSAEPTTCCAAWHTDGVLALGSGLAVCRSAADAVFIVTAMTATVSYIHIGRLTVDSHGQGHSNEVPRSSPPGSPFASHPRPTPQQDTLAEAAQLQFQLQFTHVQHRPRKSMLRGDLHR
jgi:hypothetical protein